MKRSLKKLLALLLAACLLAVSLPVTLSAATAEESVVASSGTTGDCTWTLDDNGTLTISGNGKMRDYFSTCPWGTGIKSIIIENGVTNIGEYAFYQCTGLTSVTIPDSVTTIGSEAFRGCLNLTNITIPDSVTTIGHDAFYVTEWENNQPNGLMYAGKVAYKYKGTMPENTTVDIREGTKGIADYAFFNCYNLTSVTIPNSVTSIGDSAFINCMGLTNITIPDSVTTIGNSAFYETKWERNQPNGLVYAGKVAYSYNGTMPDTDIILQEGTKGIADYAFYGFTDLTSVTIPDSVITIGNAAFRYCTGLTSVTIPDSVTTIGHDAFSLCKNLTSVTIGSSVTSIGFEAFRNCTGLTSVTILDSVTSIGYRAFGYYYDNEYKKISDFIIYGYPNTTAEDYARANEFAFVALEPVPDYIMGDVNHDNKIDVTDATMIQLCAAELVELTDAQKHAADANGDGKVDVTDATIIQLYSAELIDHLG